MMKPSTEPTPAPKLKLPVGRSTTSTDMATRLGDVGRLGLDLDLLEVAEPLHALLAVRDRLRRVQLALADRELATHHGVGRARVAVHVDALDEVELALLHLEVTSRSASSPGRRCVIGATDGVEEAAVGVVAAQPVDVGGERRAAEHRRRARARPARSSCSRSIVSSPRMSTVPTRNCGPSTMSTDDHDPVFLHVDLRLADRHADVAVVHVQALDLVEVLVEDRLGVQARVVPELADVGGEAPRLGLHHLLELAVGERLVADEVDLGEAQLLALDHVEVHADGALAHRLEHVLHLGQVVALGLVLGLDARRVLEQERIVDRRADRDGELLLDVVGAELLVAGDAHLPDHRVLVDHVGDDRPAVRGRRDLDAHVVEEAEPVDAPHVLARAEPGRTARRPWCRSPP